MGWRKAYLPGRSERRGQIMGGQIAGEAAAASYGKWIRSWFDHDASRLREFYPHLPFAPGWVAKSEP